MNWMPKMFRRRRLYDELSEEMQLHVEERTEQLMGEGTSREAAEREARRAFGNRTLMVERSREVWGWSWRESVWADLRLATRQLRRSPGFTVAAIVTLALAIGANAVVFSVMNAFLLRPLDVPRADSLYALFRPDGDAAESYADYLDLRDRTHSFDGLMAYDVLAAGLDTGSSPARAWVEEASGNYFDAMGLQPYLGRFFHEADEHGPNSAPYLVLTYAYWNSHFQGDRGVVGRVVQLNKHPFTIIGVGPKEFHGTLLFFHPDFFTPIVDHPEVGTDDLTTRSDHWIFMVMGHLKAGVTQAQARADLDAAGAYLEQNYPKDEGKMRFTLGRPSLYGDYLGRPVREFMTGLTVLSGLILLAACANLGSLFAARAADRSREVALRLALGAKRRRILRGLFTEAVLISLVGGGLGLAGGVLLLHGLSVWQPIPRWPIHLAVNPDARVYGFAVMLALVSGLLFGAVPMKQVLDTSPYEVVKAGPGGRAGRRITFRDVLLVAQIAICAVLVTSSMVAVRGLGRSLHGNFGFAVQNTTLVDTDLSMANYSGDAIVPMQKRMIEAVAAIPGVTSVAIADQVPLGDGTTGAVIYTETTSELKVANAAAKPYVYRVSPEYFQASGTALLMGRDPDVAGQQDRAAGGDGECGVCAEDFRLGRQGDGQVLQDGGWHADAGSRDCGEREVFEPDGRSDAGNVSADGAVARERDLHDRALGPRSGAAGWSDPEQAARAGAGAADLHPDAVPRAGRDAVRAADGDHDIGCAWTDGRAAFDHGHFRHGGLHGEQKTKGAWYSRGAGGAAERSIAGCAGASAEAACDRLRRGAGAWGDDEQGDRVYRVAGDAARSTGAGRGGAGDAAAWADGYVDSGTAGAVGGSDDFAAGGVSDRYVEPVRGRRVARDRGAGEEAGRCLPCRRDF